jgi:TolB protein
MHRPAVHARVVAALAAFAALAAPAAAHSDDIGRIAFDRTNAVAGTEDIYVVDADGDNLRQVTDQSAGQGAAELPAWDVCGDGLFYDGDAAGNAHVFRADLRSLVVRQITNTDGFEISPAVSPDRSLLAFEQDAADFSTSGIYIAARRGTGIGPPRQVTKSPFAAIGGFDSNPDFSPDRTRLTFMRVASTERGTARSAIFVVNVDGTGLHRLTPLKTNAIFPRWSPDGSRIAFSTNGDNFSDQLSANVFTIRPDGRGLTQVTHDANNNHSFTPDWSPDGTKLVFAHATAGEDHIDLDVHDLHSGRTSVLLRGTAGVVDQDPAWGATG